MWLQFLLENAHFSLNLFEALAVFAIFWLYFDAWNQRKTFKEVFKIAGFFLLCVSFVVHAVFLETSLVSTGDAGNSLNHLLFYTTRIGGYVLILFGLVIEPLQDKPKITKAPMAAAGIVISQSVMSFISPAPVAFPALSAIIGILYLRRATLGLESHIKRVAFAFLILSFSELLFLGYMLQKNSNPNIFKLVAPFGPLWIIEHVAVFIAVLFLLKWVFGYLFKRLQTQLFMILTTTVLVIFLLTTVAFTGLLLRNLQNETLKQLETDVKVLSFAVDGKKAENLSDAYLFSQDSEVLSAFDEKAQKGELNTTSGNFLLTKKLSTLVVVDEDGKVLARGEDRDRVGDSLSGDILVKRALLNEPVSSIVIRDGALAPIISVKSAAPVVKETKVVGAVIAGVDIDNAFVDGIKNATGLSTSIYGGNVLSATTLLSQDGRSRPIGVKEENEKIKSKVLAAGENQSMGVDILNVPYFASYIPLKDVDNTPIGMLFVGRQQIGVLQSAAKSIELTFLVTALLLVISVIPSYAISKFIASQVRS